MARESEAEAEYRRGERAGDAYASFNLGRLRYRSRRLEEAEAHFRRARESGHSDALVELAEMAAEAGRDDEAETLYREAIDSRADGAHLSYGTFLDDMDREDEAEAQWRAGIQTGEEDAHYLPAMLLGQHARDDEAEVHYRAAISEDPTNGLIRDSHGTMLWRLGRLEEAEEELRNAVQLGAHHVDPKVLSNLVKFLETQGRSREAQAVRDSAGPRDARLST